MKFVKSTEMRYTVDYTRSTIDYNCIQLYIVYKKLDPQIQPNAWWIPPACDVPTPFVPRQPMALPDLDPLWMDLLGFLHLKQSVSHINIITYIYIYIHMYIVYIYMYMYYVYMYMYIDR